ncbi:MAG TPA: RHS repeat-associated core domain-containing protein, partial [Polyangiaceae bacterium]|nr:RHS repeat-associated core domain-containing protein [Polyangiaceae bacterium]
EDYGFTSKEDDVEVGLTYFGKRFLSTHLNRWVSADPLTIHGLGADPNVYAYVGGQALKSVDALGLSGEQEAPDETAAAQEVHAQAIDDAWRDAKAQEAFIRNRYEGRSGKQILEDSVSAGVETYKDARLEEAMGKATMLVPLLPAIQGIDAAATAVRAIRASPVAAAQRGIESRVSSSQLVGFATDAKRVFDATLLQDPDGATAAIAGMQVGGERRSEEMLLAAGAVLTAGGTAPGSGAGSGAGSGSGAADVVYHYTTRDKVPGIQSKGLYSQSSATNIATLSAREAVELLGLKRLPDVVVELRNGGRFVPQKPPIVQPHPLGPGGGLDLTNPSRLPRECFVCVRSVKP